MTTKRRNITISDRAYALLEKEASNRKLKGVGPLLDLLTEPGSIEGISGLPKPQIGFLAPAEHLALPDQDLPAKDGIAESATEVHVTLDTSHVTSAPPTKAPKARTNSILRHVTRDIDSFTGKPKSDWKLEKEARLNSVPKMRPFSS